MNNTALQIYSFLMRYDIQFIRYCHDPYANHAQWESLLKKSKQACAIPVFQLFQKARGEHYILYMYQEDSALNAFLAAHPDYIAEDTAHCALVSLLHCTPHTLSPLSLMFDTDQQCELQIDDTLFQEKTWCLSPCSDTSSVLITPEAFYEKFLPAIGRKDRTVENL